LLNKRFAISILDQDGGPDDTDLVNTPAAVDKFLTSPEYEAAIGRLLDEARKAVEEELVAEEFGEDVGDASSDDTNPFSGTHGADASEWSLASGDSDESDSISFFFILFF
jgi:hypothetical protein